jgi:branched-chain amino acid transport system permease protein
VPPALEVRSVTVRFGTVTAVDDVSLALPKGSVTALLGPNGAGKSTLINAITGFVPATGEILLDGARVSGPPHRRARAGLRRSFQQLRVPPGLTAGAFMSTAAGRRLSAEEIDEFLTWFGCPPAEVPIGAMDVGTRRLLEVAGLAAGKPSVLMLDEPAAGQGARETERLSRRIAEIPERTGSTVLLVEHDIDLVRAACDSLVVMDFGRVIGAGEPDAVLAEPAVVKAYVGTSSTRSTQAKAT